MMDAIQSSFGRDISSSAATRFREPQVQSVKEELHRIRNIGIIAHIDAGKTTTTERILYLTGKINHQGSVDTGDTVTDFMPQERERGITIQSAAVSVTWGNARINVIDTPGHIDFGVEVERCTRVLDGAVLVLDGVAGVQAQTETVWRTAQKHSIPAVSFVNKLDREGADFQHVLTTLERRLGVTPLPLQVPVGSSNDFRGMVDLITMTAVIYQAGADGKGTLRASARDSVSFSVATLDEAERIEPGITKIAKEARQNLLWGLADVDEEFSELVLGREEAGLLGVEYTVSEILAAVRRACLSLAGVPVLCGASLKGIGVEPLLDCVTSFLPSPLDRPRARGVIRPALVCASTSKAGKRKSKKIGRGVDGAAGSTGAATAGGEAGGEVVVVDPLQDELVAFVFKVSFDRQRGMLAFFRVYSGTLAAKVSVFNTTRGEEERPLQVLRVEADDFRAVDSVSAGDVAVAVGLSHAVTGDTLVSPANLGLRGLQLDGVTIPPPVFSLAVEAESSGQQLAFEAALAHMVREDPSLVVDVDEESGQTVLRGIGELHLEVVCDRLQRQFAVDVQTGRAYVAYREGISEEYHIEDDYERTFGGKTISVGLAIKVIPVVELAATPEIEVYEEVAALLDSNEMDALQGGLRDALSRGPAGGYPMAGLVLYVTSVTKHGDRTTPGALRFAAASAVMRAAREAGGGLLEPVMDAEIWAPESYIGTVLNDLTANRRAEVRSVDLPSATQGGMKNSLGARLRGLEQAERGLQRDLKPGVGSRHEVRVKVPLRELLGYATTLRSISAGEANFTMELGGYTRMDGETQRTVLEGR